MSSKFDKLYNDSYFSKRLKNDFKRIASFKQEADFLINNGIEFNGIVCDVGCSTGEFLDEINWTGQKFGMEVSSFAINLAKSKGISFEKNILNQNNYFDLIIFRGTIQHLPSPFEYIEAAYNSLKIGGKICFLATPNSNSIVYKLNNTLPALDPKLNFYIPSDKTLINICKNFGFVKPKVEKLYINSPYSSIIKDHLKFILNVVFKTKPNFPFWGNMMNIIMEKQ